MYELIVKGRELYDPKTRRFSYEKDVKIQLEHSLASIKKWESRWHIHYIGNTELTEKQILDYIWCMILTPNIPHSIVNRLSREDIQGINNYMNDQMTATTFKKNDDDGSTSNEFISNETVYWWMVELGIPQEYQYWHINQLLTLIRFISIKREKPKKQSSRDRANMLEKRRKLNEQRRKEAAERAKQKQ